MEETLLVQVRETLRALKLSLIIRDRIAVGYGLQKAYALAETTGSEQLAADASQIRTLFDQEDYLKIYGILARLECRWLGTGIMSEEVRYDDPTGR